MSLNLHDSYVIVERLSVYKASLQVHPCVWLIRMDFFSSAPFLFTCILLLSLLVVSISQTLVEELLLNKTKHGCTILFCRSLLDILDLCFDNDIGDHSKLHA